ncbi:hypothetical protein [Amycolatopsis sp. NPDC059021]|uniref:hypothetical protein n=1 Tax=Amycolatopsis sp. NPDC059021 TaxID=3346704 RepID=UPI00366ED037
MSQRIGLPTVAEVHATLDAMRAHSGRVSVLALAQALGLANTTFRRNYPTVVAALATRRDHNLADAATAPTGPGPEAGSHADSLTLLRRDNQELRAQLDLACAQIQRLSLDNDALRRQLEAAQHIPRIRGR